MTSVMPTKSFRKLLFAVTAILFIALLAIFLLNQKDKALGDNVTPAVTKAEISSAPELPEIDRSPIATIDPILKSTAMPMLQAVVKCQAMAGYRGRLPQENAIVEVAIELQGERKILSQGKSNSEGEVVLDIPLGIPFSLRGKVPGVTASRAVPALSEEELKNVYRGVIELDFYFERLNILYQISTREHIEGLPLYFAISDQPFPEEIRPRRSEHSVNFRAPDTQSVVSGSFTSNPFHEVHWGLFDQFGMLLKQGRSGTMHQPGEEVLLKVEIEKLGLPQPRYFRIIDDNGYMLTPKGVLLTLRTDNYLRYSIFDETGNERRSTEAQLSEDGRFSVRLPAAHTFGMLVQHPRLAAITLQVGEFEGLDEEHPILITARAKPRVFFLKSDFPDLAVNSSVSFYYSNGLRGKGVVSLAIKDLRDLGDLGDLEKLESLKDFNVKGGWCEAVRSLKIGHRIFLVDWKGEMEVQIPSNIIREVQLPEIVECQVNIALSQTVEREVDTKFMVRGHVWKSFSTIGITNTSLRMPVWLPKEPGVIQINQEFGAPANLPYTINENNEIFVKWIVR